MKKQEFLDKLRASLWSMPEADKERSVDYYAEMIDDRLDEGISEEEAVAAVGDFEEILQQILTESPRPPQTVNKKQKRQKRGLEPWMIVLLVLGSPLWISLVAGILSAVLGIYVSLWSVVIVFYALTVAVAAISIGCLVGIFFMIGRFAEVIVMIGAAFLCAGIAIVLLLLGNLVAKGMVKLTKLCWQGMRRLFGRKERIV